MASHRNKHKVKGIGGQIRGQQDMMQKLIMGTYIPYTWPELAKKHVLFKGWARYIAINSVTVGWIKAFRENFYYKEQFKGERKVDPKEVDDSSPIYVPAENKFWFVLTRNNLNILSSRRNDMARTIDSIDILQIDPIIMEIGQKPSGGINDDGNYIGAECFTVKGNSVTQGRFAY